jgi:hypothetical protein
MDGLTISNAKRFIEGSGSTVTSPEQFKAESLQQGQKSFADTLTNCKKALMIKFNS